MTWDLSESQRLWLKLVFLCKSLIPVYKFALIQCISTQFCEILNVHRMLLGVGFSPEVRELRARDTPIEEFK